MKFKGYLLILGCIISCNPMAANQTEYSACAHNWLQEYVKPLKEEQAQLLLTTFYNGYNFFLTNSTLRNLSNEIIMITLSLKSDIIQPSAQHLIYKQLMTRLNTVNTLFENHKLFAQRWQQCIDLYDNDSNYQSSKKALDAFQDIIEKHVHDYIAVNDAILQNIAINSRDILIQSSKKLDELAQTFQTIILEKNNLPSEYKIEPKMNNFDHLNSAYAAANNACNTAKTTTIAMLETIALSENCQRATTRIFADYYTILYDYLSGIDTAFLQLMVDETGLIPIERRTIMLMAPKNSQSTE